MTMAIPPDVLCTCGCRGDRHRNRCGCCQGCKGCPGFDLASNREMLLRRAQPFITAPGRIVTTHNYNQLLVLVKDMVIELRAHEHCDGDPIECAPSAKVGEYDEIERIFKDVRKAGELLSAVARRVRGDNEVARANNERLRRKMRATVETLRAEVDG